MFPPTCQFGHTYTHQIPSIGRDKLFDFEGEGLFFYIFFFSSLTREIKWFSVRQTSGETQQRLIWIKLKVGILDVISQGLSDHLLFMSLQLVFFFSPSRQHSESQTSLPALVDAAAAWTQDVHSKFSVRKHMHPCSRKKKERKKTSCEQTVQEKLDKSL